MRNYILREIPNDFSCLKKALEDPKAYWDKKGIAYKSFTDTDPVIVFQGIKAIVHGPHECDCPYCDRDYDKETRFFINEEEYNTFIDNSGYDKDEIEKEYIWLIGKFKQDTDYELGNMTW